MPRDRNDDRVSFRFPLPAEKLAETGERYISGVIGDVQNEHYHRYLFAVRYCVDKDVLDIASGEGYGSYLLSQIARTVVGVDVDGPTVDYANRTYRSGRLSYKQGNATALPIADSSIDVVISFETLEHFVDHQAFCDEVNRVLRPGGLLIISSPNREIYTEEAEHHNEFHLKELDRAEFDQLISKNFQNYAVFGQRPILGSVIVADPPDRAIAPVEDLDTPDGLLFHRANLSERATYFIAMASNAALPLLGSSVMHNPRHLEVLSQAQTEQTRVLALVQAELDRLRVEAAGIEAARAVAEAGLTTTRGEMADLEAEVVRLGAELERLGTEKSETTLALRAREEEVERLSLELERLGTEKSETTLALRAREEEVERLSLELGRLGTEKSETTLALRAREEEVERLSLELERLGTEKSETTQALRVIEDEVERGRAETLQSSQRLEASDETLRRLRVEHDQMRHSLSWRITAPLRAASSRLPTARRLLRRALKITRWAMTGQLSAQLRIRWDLLTMRRLIKRSGLFDRAWYIRRYPDIGESGLDPILHYLITGAAQGRSPSPKFSTQRYQWQNPDVVGTGMNPLIHYIKYGKAEGRAALPIPARDLHCETPRVRRSADEEYDAWIQRYDTLLLEDIGKIRAEIEAMVTKPLISIVMPVYNPPTVFLARAIESVREQLYPHWELCIADDASTDPAVSEVLTRFAALDERVKVRRRHTNGHISAASNTALELATGDYVALLDHDDELPELALFYVAREIAEHPDTDLLFSDEDKIDESGLRSAPYFKSGWNPALMLSQNAFSHLGVFRRTLVEQVGGFRSGFEGSQDYDLVLRVSELTTPKRIRHIPRILYHWRIIPGSTAAAGSEKPYAWLAGQRAIEDHLRRIGQAAKVLPAAGGAFYRVAYELPEEPRVSIIIPTRDGLDLLCGCIDSLRTVSTYRNVEIIIVDNGSTDPKTLSYLADLERAGSATILRDDREFNYSRLNNAAAEIATGDYLCLLNNDTLVISPDWLHEMVSHAVRPGVGAVGAMLYYADDTIQHAGVIAGLGGVAGHVHRALPRGDFGYFGRAAVTQDLSIVTGACLLTSRAIYREMGGLNERDLTVAFNDVDYCLRLGSRGYRVVWTPFAELYHLESISRGNDLTGAKRKRFSAETAYMKQQWASVLESDPYYNVNLDLYSSTPRISLQPRLPPLTA